GKTIHRVDSDAEIYRRPGHASVARAKEPAVADHVGARGVGELALPRPDHLGAAATGHALEVALGQRAAPRTAAISRGVEPARVGTIRLTVVRRPHGSARRDVEIVDAVPAHLAEAGVGAAGALRHLGGAQLEPSARGLRPARATVSAEPDAR